MIGARQLCGILPLLILSSTALAERPTVDPNAELTILYAAPIFNKDSRVLDKATLLLREGDTGRLLEVTLSETTEDSATFRVKTTLKDWRDLKKVYPEVYAPTPDQSATKEALEAFKKLITSQKVSRSPTIFKKHRNGIQILDVYDNERVHAEGVKAYKEYLQMDKSQQEVNRRLNRKFPEKELIDSTISLEKTHHLLKLERQESERIAARLRRAQVIKEDLNKKTKSFLKLPTAKRKARVEASKKQAQRAMMSYRSKKFRDALVLFNKSLNANPSDLSHLFYHGVAYYRNGYLDEALIYLNLANPKSNELIERDFFTALAHYHLQEFNAALYLFRDIKSKNHRMLSPSSSFYEGMILYGQEKYLEAREPFQWVIDNALDKKMILQAKSYLKEISWKLHYKRAKVYPWVIQGDFEFSYDSNILYATDSEEEQGTAGLADVRDGFRTEAIFDFEYRVFHHKSHELSTILNTAYMYSLKNDFVRADYWLTEVTLPYSMKGKTFDLPSKWKLSPLFDVLYMDANDIGKREEIQTSGGLETELTLGVTNHYFTTYSFTVTGVNSTNLSDVTGRDNSDAVLYEFSTDQSFYLDRFHRQAFTPSLGLKLNDAEGENKAYHRFDFGLTYLDSTWWSATWYAHLNVYFLQFPDHDEERSDTNYSLTIGIQRPINQNWNWGFVISGTDNTSNVVANDYSKLTALLSIGFNIEK